MLASVETPSRVFTVTCDVSVCRTPVGQELRREFYGPGSGGRNVTEKRLSFVRRPNNGYSSMFRRSYVQKVLCSEGPLFRRSYVQKVLCSEGSIFRRFYVQKVLCSEIFVQKVLCSESRGDYGTRRFCNVEAASMTLIQCRKNVVCSVGFSELK